MSSWNNSKWRGTLGASLLGNILPGKGNVRVGYGNKKGKATIARSDSKESRRQGRGMLRAAYANKMDC